MAANPVNAVHRRTSALHFKRFRNAMYAAVRAVPEGGIWCDSFNHHVYAQHTLWNITPHRVTVFHFNFLKHKLGIRNELEILRNESQPHLDQLKITVIITLQDVAQSLMHNATLPLTHFTGQTLIALGKIEKSQIIDNNFHNIYTGFLFENSIKKFDDLKIMRNEVCAVFSDMKSRPLYRFDTNLVNAVNTDKMVNAIKSWIDGLFPYNLTAEIVRNLFTALRCLWMRKECNTNDELRANTNLLMPHLQQLRQVFLVQTPVTENVPNSCYVFQTLNTYHDILLNNPLIPHECLLFSFDYELSLTSRKLKNNITGILHVLERLPQGKTYCAGSFNFWCGSSNKEVVYPIINCANVINDLNQYLN